MGEDRVHRAGLLATHGIRGGANRKVLERIKQTSDIFMAWSDQDWVQDGVAVHVSMVGFGDDDGVSRILDGRIVQNINADLTAMSDLTTVLPLVENQRRGFRGNQKGGPFDIPGDVARAMLAEKNTDGRNNRDVIRPWFNGLDVTRRPRDMWIIDFGTHMPIEDAQKYEAPFDYVQKHVYPTRKDNNRRAYADRWWIHMEARPSMRAAIKPLARYIVTPHVTKHRVFAWLDSTIIPDHQLIVFARDDDYFFGVLHSKVHELWSLGTGTQLREVESGFRYTPSTTFETFPFPWHPG
jgi:type II restriction/modification system DNA methylase subunit YeeA